MKVDQASATREDAAHAPEVMIIDDHPMVGEALSLAILLAAPDARIRTLDSFAQARAALAEGGPDLVLLDLDLGEGGDWSPLMTLRRERPETPVAIVSATQRRDVMARARELGAAGYLKKSDELAALGDAVAALLAGAFAFPADLVETAEEAAGGLDDGALARLASLTPTQARVLDGLRRGLLNKQIAYELDISISTTKAHMTAIFRKLGVQNRTQALLTARSLEIDPATDHSAAARGA